MRLDNPKEIYNHCVKCWGRARKLESPACHNSKCECHIIMKYPTLSELIEACGGKFHYLSDSSCFKNLEGITQKWVAHSKDHSRMGLGSTPEEAVAKLWLELDK